MVDIERRLIERFQLERFDGIPGSSFAGRILILNIARNLDLVIPENGNIGLVVTCGNIHPQQVVGIELYRDCAFARLDQILDLQAVKVKIHRQLQRLLGVGLRAPPFDCLVGNLPVQGVVPVVTADSSDQAIEFLGALCVRQIRVDPRQGAFEGLPGKRFNLLRICLATGHLPVFNILGYGDFLKFKRNDQSHRARQRYPARIRVGIKVAVQGDNLQGRAHRITQCLAIEIVEDTKMQAFPCTPARNLLLTDLVILGIKLIVLLLFLKDVVFEMLLDELADGRTALWIALVFVDRHHGVFERRPRQFCDRFFKSVLPGRSLCESDVFKLHNIGGFSGKIRRVDFRASKVGGFRWWRNLV